MHLAACILFPLLLTAWETRANPIQSEPESKNQAHLSRRALPQFLANLDQEKTAAIQQGWRDMTTVIRRVTSILDTGTAAERSLYWTVFDKYFQPEHQEAVQTIFKNVIGTDVGSETGASSLENIIIDGDDFLLGSPGIPSWNQKPPTAYTQNPFPENDFKTKMHFMASSGRNAYAYKSLAEITPRGAQECDAALGDTVSWKMLSFGGYAVLHEIMHVNFVTQAPVSGFEQPKQAVRQDRGDPKDVLRIVGDFEYGPQMTRILKSDIHYKFEDKPFPNGPVVNADSYAWFANELYWSDFCQKQFNDPQDNKFEPDEVATDNTFDMDSLNFDIVIQ